MPEKEKKETIEGQILRKLEDIEREFNEKIRNVEASLERLDESSTLITDDQLFFGFVFSLALLILTLPAFDVSTLFESFGFEIREASGIITTKDVTVIALIIASIVRYVVTFTRDERKNTLRRLSVSILIASFYVIMLDLFIRVLGDVFGDIHWLLIILSPISFNLLTTLFGIFVEERWYQCYPSHEPNGSNNPIVSVAFSFVGSFILLSYLFTICVTHFVPLSNFITALILVASAIVTVLLIILVIKTERKLKKEMKVNCNKAQLLIHRGFCSLKFRYEGFRVSQFCHVYDFSV